MPSLLGNWQSLGQNKRQALQPLKIQLLCVHSSAKGGNDEHHPKWNAPLRESTPAGPGSGKSNILPLLSGTVVINEKRFRKAEGPMS